ncbi:hypothetical protein GALL_552520 [mine drainage metagenome]|uniref:DUF559 domain-containing protein n=1 Tax=mine drainage metagenome TaxID=410659 RepID=A0A1J5P5W4_9ZZZZ
MTPPEVMLWVRLRKRVPGEPVFRRQHPVGPYILDFYCSAARLAVEVDGQGHGEAEQIRHDEIRDRWLASQGVTVHRMPASSILKDAAASADAILRLAADLAGGVR